MQASNNLALSVARRFAQALDQENYAAAERLLSPLCWCLLHRDEIAGPSAIVASYQEHGNWGAKTLDSVRYESHVRPLGHREAVVTFIDHIEHSGERLTYSCEQHLTIDDEGLICSIEHRELPGQSERALAFYRRVGIVSHQKTEE